MLSRDQRVGAAHADPQPQQEGDRGEPEHQPPPQSAEPANPHAEPPAERQPEQPVSDYVEYGCRTRATHAAQHAAADNLRPIEDELNHDPANKLTIEQWATKVGASSRTLNRLFNKHYGMGFSRWKQKLKILKSLEMLNTGTQLTNIAFELGYESTSAFITGFKKQLGCSPKKYLSRGN